MARERRPDQPGAHRAHRQQADAFDFFLFFSYRYYHAYHGVRACRTRRSWCRPPSATPRSACDLRAGLPRRARADVQLAEERAIIQAVSGNNRCPGVVVGIGSDLPRETAPGRFRQKFDISRPFAIYVGRIDENKGCVELFDYFGNYRPRLGQQLTWS